jgi:hypothetical protein
MRSVFPLGTLFAGWLSLTVPAFAGSPVEEWPGLWRIEVARGTGAILNVVVSAKGTSLAARYYSEPWIEGPFSGAAFEADKAVLTSTARARSFRLNLQRNGDRVEGTWELVHPQFTETHSLRGRRVFRDPGWDPLGRLRAAGPQSLADLSGLLVSEAPLESFEAFRGFWDREVVPRYYLAIEDVFYSHPAGGGDREVRIRRFYDLLKEPSYREAAAAFRAGFERVGAAAGKVYSLEDVIVPFPSFGDFETSIRVVGETIVLRVGLDEVSRSLAGEGLDRWIAREVLRLPTFRFFPPIDRSVAAQVIREGVADGLAVHLGLNSGEGVPCVADGEDVDARLNEARSKLRVPPGQSPRPGVLNECELEIVARFFGRRVFGSFGPEEILGMAPGQLLDLYSDFVGE